MAAIKKIHKNLVNRKLVLVCVILLVVGSWCNSKIEDLLTQPVTSWQSEVQADCGIALTGGAGRLREGLDLLVRHSIKKLILAGVYPGTTLRDLFPVLPFYPEIAEEDVILDQRSGTTYGNAQQTFPIVEALRCKDVVLITSQIHMPRAYKTFRNTFPDRVPIIQHSVSAGLSESSYSETGVEVLKDLLYSTFAY